MFKPGRTRWPAHKVGCRPREVAPQRHNFWHGDSMNAPLPPDRQSPAGPISLDDKYTLERGRVFLTGTQALIRLPMQQRIRDAHAGLNTAGFVSGYRGSPLGSVDQTADEGEEVPGSAARALPPRRQRRPGRHRDLGHAAGQPVRRRAVRRRVRHVVRQGAGRGPLRRRLQARATWPAPARTAACWCWPATTMRPSPRPPRTRASTS